MRVCVHVHLRAVLSYCECTVYSVRVRVRTCGTGVRVRVRTCCVGVLVRVV